MPITPRQVTSAGPAIFVAQFLNTKATSSPVRARHGRSRSLTEGGAKSDFFPVTDTRDNNNAAPDSELPALSVTTPDTVTPSTSPRGRVVRVPPNTPAKSPGQEIVELRARVLGLEQDARDARDKCDKLARENEVSEQVRD